MAKYIAKFTAMPKEMFRLNMGTSVALRDGVVKRRGAFDIWTYAGKVKPKALDPDSYVAPNGASMRPNTPKMHANIADFPMDVVVFSLAPGTPLPEDLVLVHERRDHYSLQPAKEMTLTELNAKITAFLNTSGRLLTREEWLREYPNPTERN